MEEKNYIDDRNLSCKNCAWGMTIKDFIIWQDLWKFDIEEEADRIIKEYGFDSSQFYCFHEAIADVYEERINERMKTENFVFNPVTGSPEELPFVKCEEVRCCGGVCGIEGKYFEETQYTTRFKLIVEKIKNLFRRNNS
jgi:hypothetical protein